MHSPELGFYGRIHVLCGLSAALSAESVHIQLLYNAHALHRTPSFNLANAAQHI